MDDFAKLFRNDEAFASVDQEKAFTIARDALAGPMSCFSSQLTEEG